MEVGLTQAAPYKNKSLSVGFRKQQTKRLLRAHLAPPSPNKHGDTEMVPFKIKPPQETFHCKLIVVLKLAGVCTKLDFELCLNPVWGKL